MAKRQFSDEHGVLWIVWDVHPDDLGRVIYDRRATPRESSETESNEGTDRPTNGRSVDPELQRGWLCFQTGIEKRRFTPIPVNWHELPDSVLRVMLQVASPAAQIEGRVPRPSVSE